MNYSAVIVKYCSFKCGTQPGNGKYKWLLWSQNETSGTIPSSDWEVLLPCLGKFSHIFKWEEAFNMRLTYQAEKPRSYGFKAGH